MSFLYPKETYRASRAQVSFGYKSVGSTGVIPRPHRKIVTLKVSTATLIAARTGQLDRGGTTLAQKINLK